MEMIYDFAETNTMASIFIYKKSMKSTKVDPSVEDGRMLRISDGIMIELHRDVHPEIEIRESDSRIELHLKKMHHVKWGGISGREPPVQKEQPVVEDEEEIHSAMDLFSKIYNSNEDARRAMEKSFYESEGTVLSTDWSQVKTRKVERED